MELRVLSRGGKGGECEKTKEGGREGGEDGGREGEREGGARTRG